MTKYMRIWQTGINLERNGDDLISAVFGRVTQLKSTVWSLFLFGTLFLLIQFQVFLDLLTQLFSENVLQLFLDELVEFFLVDHGVSLILGYFHGKLNELI